MLHDRGHLLKSEGESVKEKPGFQRGESGHRKGLVSISTIDYDGEEGEKENEEREEVNVGTIFGWKDSNGLARCCGRGISEDGLTDSQSIVIKKRSMLDIV